MTVLTIQREGELAIALLDNPPVNALSTEVRQALWDAVDELETDDAVRAVVLICEGRTFIAGADVREFGQTPKEPHLPDLVSKIEASGTPWVAAIHGNALGGGLEVALGCRFRIASASAKLGLPEVNLGIIPGASGTVRTPRLVGVEHAVALATSGKPISATEARSMGLIDAVSEGDLRTDALTFVRSALGEPLPEPISARTVASPSGDFWSDKASALSKGGAAAPLRALASIRYAAEHDFEAAMAFERETFLELRPSREAAALRYVFFAERAAPKPASVKGIEPKNIASAVVVGGGTMGAGIAAALADAGLEVSIIERDAESAERARGHVKKILDGSVKRKKLSPEAAEARLAAMGFDAGYAAAETADLVIEAVFEDLGVKREAFARLGAVCRPDAILATNTSYLDPRAIAEGLPGPERFIGLHFFSPAHVMKLLEIVPTPETSSETLATAFALAKRLRKMPVKAGICHGFIGNRILRRYRGEAEALLLGGADVAQVDAAMREMGFKMGPFEAQDMGGIDIAFLEREGRRKNGAQVEETLADELVRAGRKGKKTVAGWYDYDADGKNPKPSSFVKELVAGRASSAANQSVDGAVMARHLVETMADEGKKILDEGIADSPADIDLVKIHGYGFPRHLGGPMFYTSADAARGDS